MLYHHCTVGARMESTLMEMEMDKVKTVLPSLEAANYCNSLTLYFYLILGPLKILVWPRTWHWQWDFETVIQDLGNGSSHLEWQLSSRGQFSGGMVEMVSCPSDGWIHCPRWLDGWLRMRDGWPEMVVTRLCRLMALMAINRLIGYQQRTDSNHCQSNILPWHCTCSEPFKCS